MTTTSPIGSPSSFRNRMSLNSLHMAGEYDIPGDISPTSSTFSTSTSFSDRLGPSHTFSSLNVTAAPPVHKLTIRTNPTISTCFDPADKELYDLWAPKA
ncbi:hypothetical protein EVG20_g3478 [Dentipellis fragilis]|uniref:Uncharacterized protein n=1 Tax=Dentipellis fragilis TaxID=205917 RepID=A0A4Y9Z431_9AGAM|nr:hypothetical protein EVG20_g3478 [Dentipellis fragilis]